MKGGGDLVADARLASRVDLSARCRTGTWRTVRKIGKG
jgi:hypothetical protein